MKQVVDARRLVKNNLTLTTILQPYYRYETNRLREGRELIQGRFDFMLTKFLEAFPSLQNLDPQRLFDEYQKRVIYQRADHRCQDPQDNHCLDETAFTEGEADHIVPHSAGGQTSIENGQWLCTHCNRVKYVN